MKCGGRVIAGSVVVAGLILAVTGCGGGNKLVTNRGGEVEEARYNGGELPSAPVSDEYYIGYGDVLDVLFLYNSDYSREGIKVRPDGRISFQYVGEVAVAGKTPAYVDSLLTSKFSEILRDPQITVIIRDFQEQMIYVLGEVGRPGGYRYERGLTLMQGLSLGNGLSRDARKNGVVVVRRIAPEHILGIEINVDDILKNNRFDLDIPLRPFDIIMVPRSRLATTEDFIRSITGIIMQPADLYLKGWQVMNIQALYEFYRSTGRQN